MSLNFKQETGRLSSSSSLNHILLHPKRFELCSILHHPLGTISKTNKQIKTNSKNAPNTKKLTKFVLGAITRSSERILSLLWGKGKRNSIPLVLLFWACLWNRGGGVVGVFPTSTNPSSHPARVSVAHTRLSQNTNLPTPCNEFYLSL